MGTALAPKASWRSELGAYWNPRQSRWWPALCVVLVPEAEQAKDGFGCCIGTSGRASECWYWVLYWYLRQSRLRLVLDAVLVPEAEQVKAGNGCCTGTAGWHGD